MAKHFVRLIIAIVVFAALAGAAYFWLMSRQTAAEEAPQVPVPFGYKTAWYAVHSDDAQGVASALHLSDIHSSDWTTGTTAALDWNDGTVFVTPPVHGWVFAEGAVLFSDTDRDRRFENRLVSLSDQFGEAQYFASMRVSDAYTWARAKGGYLDCMFEWADGQMHRQGNAKQVEEQVGLKFFDAASAAAKDPGYYKRNDLTYPDEEDVLKVATAWGLNPMKIETYPEAGATGFIGRYRP
jgi:hypothetical protein